MASVNSESYWQCSSQFDIRVWEWLLLGDQYSDTLFSEPVNLCVTVANNYIPLLGSRYGLFLFILMNFMF